METNNKVINSANKFIGYKSSVDNIIDSLKSMNSSVENDFDGSTKEELVEKINEIINSCYNLEADFVEAKTSLLNLSTDIVNEEKRKEDLEKQKKIEEKDNN